MHNNILILGAAGQIGSELTELLRKRYPNRHVIASDIQEKPTLNPPYFRVDATCLKDVKELIFQQNVKEVYLLAAMLSATAEKHPQKAWELNMQSLLNILELAKEGFINKVFWPSSIAVFGSTSPKTNTPQQTILEPTTVYGISKLAGENWCNYYYTKYGVDVRSLRYPGLISWKTPPGGGTTDYAIDIFHYALQHEPYTCFLKQDTVLPMMYMEDALQATIALMEAPSEKLSVRTSYNLSGISFSPAQLTKIIRKHFPNFNTLYQPDFRQAIADSWPQSVDDSFAQRDWGWKPSYNLEKIAKAMIDGLQTL